MFLFDLDLKVVFFYIAELTIEQRDGQPLKQKYDLINIFKLCSDQYLGQFT